MLPNMDFFKMTEPQRTTGKNDDNAQSLRSELTCLERLQVMTTILVSIFGIFISWQANNAAYRASKLSKTVRNIEIELQKQTLEDKRVQEFAKIIHDQLTNLSGKESTKAKIALASLYSLAKEDSDKFILFTIAIVSENEGLKNTIADLISEDSYASDTFKEKIRVKLGKRLTPSSPNTKVTENKFEVTKQTEVETKFLQKLTQEQDKINGWIYLGKVKSGSSTLSGDKTIKTNEIPVVNAIIETATSINLRENHPSGRGLGAIKGIFAKDSRLRVKDIKQVKIDPKYNAVWAEVSENSNS